MKKNISFLFVFGLMVMMILAGSPVKGVDSLVHPQIVMHENGKMEILNSFISDFQKSSHDGIQYQSSPIIDGSYRIYKYHQPDCIANQLQPEIEDVSSLSITTVNLDLYAVNSVLKSLTVTTINTVPGDAVGGTALDSIVSINGLQLGLTAIITYLLVWLVKYFLKIFHEDWDGLDPVKQNKILKTIQYSAGTLAGIAIALIGHTYSLHDPTFLNYLKLLWNETANTLIGIWIAGGGHDVAKWIVRNVVYPQLLFKKVGDSLPPEDPAGKK